MVQIDIAYRGELRCEATHASSSVTVVTDAPLDNHGLGQSFSPTDLLATALGTCMLTIMGIVARKHSWDLQGATASVVKHMAQDPDRRVGKLEVALCVPGEWDARQRDALVAAAKTCPVACSLGESVDVLLKVTWG